MRGINVLLATTAVLAAASAAPTA
jgi:hypothetical protein